MREKYINPFTDFGFKKIFGEEANKDLLIDFLNELIKDKGKITDLTFLKNEHLGIGQEDRKEGLQQGLEKGEKNKAENTAKMMKAEGEPMDKIMKYTGLTQEEIEKL